MRHSNIELTATATGLRIASLVILMLGVLAILVHNVVYPDRNTTAGASRNQEEARFAIFDSHRGW